ncbi:MAG: DNA-directed RNA polymerase subunit beta [Alphaproteobacteria bacterium]
MVRSFTERKRLRRSFGRVCETVPLPDLIALQKASYESFLQYHAFSAERKKIGLQEVFEQVFPIRDYSGRAQLEFHCYYFDVPKYDEVECRQQGLTYAAPLRVTFRLIVWDADDDTEVRSIHDIKEQDVYMGDIPLMTDKGTFIINGIERVVVSQMHRSPGVLFEHDQGKTHSSGKYLFAARIVPYRGSWIDFEFDPKDILYARIDRKKKFLLTTFLMTLDSKETHEKRVSLKQGEALDSKDVTGMSEEEILNTFYEKITLKKQKDGSWVVPFKSDHWRGVKTAYDLVDAKSGRTIVESGNKITVRIIHQIENENIENLKLLLENLKGKFVAYDHINEKTGEIYFEAGDEITDELLKKIEDLEIDELTILQVDNMVSGAYLLNTLKEDQNHNREEALIDIYRTLRPGEPPTVEGGAALLYSMFFDPDRYDLSAVGRVKINARLGFDTLDSLRVLRKEDVICILRTLLDLKNGKGEVDDIDNLGNRRVRSVGELLENQYRLGIVRMERTVRERMGSIGIDTVMPNDLINSKPITAVIREFFGSSQLSQFMDQTNPLSEITHKRRLSALGPGGLTRDRAGFEVRDVHPTHYGRICPIETPEGPNIGLINSLATYAHVNKYGFIESLYKKVVDGVVTDEIVYLTALEERRYIIAQANVVLDENSRIVDELVTCRKNTECGIFPRSEVDLMDVSSKQLVSVASALVPFLENDDASRALMGSNMQRQAVPLLKTEAPLVGTGMEKIVARDSGSSVVAKHSGVVNEVDGERIVIQTSASDEMAEGSYGVDIYNLQKFQGSNMNTCINQKPLVKKGDIIRKGDIIADGPSTDLGELALGHNVLVAFMSWQGYNFEDSILISERLVQQDKFTSIHIESFEIMARDTKLGNEELTRDIPGVGEEILRNLDESGIVYVGAEVKSGDILVGKVTPKGEAPLTPEEKLLRAIFGEKASDVRDSSLRVPPGISGTVVEVRSFSRRGIEKDERSIALERQEIERLLLEREVEQKILERYFYNQIKEKLINKKLEKGNKKDQIVDDEYLKSVPLNKWRDIVVSDKKVMSEIVSDIKEFDKHIGDIYDKFDKKVEKVRGGSDLPPGVLKMVKVFVAMKRKLQAGDKMAGRHGNKGVVSKIVPVEDMPYLEDGTPIDIILNPLGVPSRMNVGQVLETHLGAAAAELGKKVQEAFEQHKETLDNVKKVLSTIYEDKKDREYIKKMTEEDFCEFLNNIKEGIPMATPVFDGIHIDEIGRQLKKAGLDVTGQRALYDGRTGEPFDRKVTIGYIYILKLHHLVDDKIHARSIGPYSLVTQQPLGGKAQFGGQRFGEMEVWALEAYGAAYTLREMLTVKSDDVTGRTKAYEAIVRGDDNMEPGIPESFNVLVKELRSLGLNMNFEQKY